MASNSGKTIDIVTTNGRYTALREDDPIWSGFLPDADIIKNLKEYHVSESVSAAIDSQWDAYHRFLEYLDGIAFVEFTAAYSKRLVPQTLELVVSEANSVTVNGTRILSKNREIVTRREALTRRDPSVWMGARSGLGAGVIVVDRSEVEVRCALAYSHSVKLGDPMTLYIIIYDEPDAMVYLDEIDKIAHILNLPEGFEMWVPTRDLSTGTRAEARVRKERIAHTIRAGRAQYVTGVPILPPDDSARKSMDDVTMDSLLKRVYDRGVLHRLDIEVDSIPRYFMYTLGTIRLASLTGYQSPPGGLYDIGGVVWSDVIPAFKMYEDDVVEQQSSDKQLPRYLHAPGTSILGAYMTDWLRFMAKSLVSSELGGDPGIDPRYAYKNSLPRARAIINDRMALALPPDVDPNVVGLSSILGDDKPINMLNSLQRTVNLVIKRFRDAQDASNPHYRRRRAEMGITDDTELGEVLLNETSPAVANILLLSLIHWAETHPNMAARTSVPQLIEELDAALASLEL